jgi:hypothetical protein
MYNLLQKFVTLFLILPFSLKAQTPQRQVSFALESQSHEYYVKQAELWWKEIEKNKTSEDNWYNFFKACRNAQGTAGWREDFVNESQFLKSSDEIIQLMEEYIPNSFTYNYVAYARRGIDPSKGEYLIKAYKMNPSFEEIKANMITYSVSILDFDLRKKVNIEWYIENKISPGLLSYAYNVLMSVEPRSIIFTQHDNDSYPVWMLQDAKGIRGDVWVINFDFLLLDSYREQVFEKLKIKPIEIDLSQGYEINWPKVLSHILNNYNLERPVYFGMTVTPKYYKEFSNNMTVSGLTYKFSRNPSLNVEYNKSLIENKFLLDYIKLQVVNDYNQTNVNKQNKNYLNCFEPVYNYYIAKAQKNQADKISDLARIVASNSGDSAFIEKVTKIFTK